jgi:hypothetical protein
MAFGLAGSGTTPPIFPTGSTANTLSSTGFIPEIWSGKLIEKFYASTVLAAISNTDYEGEIANQGDKVRIRTKPTITIRDYLADGALTLERPAGNQVTLDIDKGKYFNTILDDVMDVQSDINNMSIWADDAAQQMKITIDTQVLGSSGILGAAATRNKGSSAGQITQSVNLGVSSTGPLNVVARSPGTSQVEILDVLLRLGQVLDEQNIPEQGRWVVMPVWAATYLKFSELRQTYLTGDGVSVMRNGRLGMIDRFTLYVSNLLPRGSAGGLAGSEDIIYAGHAHALTFASQISKVETLRSESTFGNILRGLQVYGYKVLDSTAIAQAVVVKG